MRILILHRVTDKMIRHATGIDHAAHDVTYVGPADRLATLPSDLRCTRIERPDTGDLTDEVLAAVDGLPAFDMVLALSEFDLIAGARVRAALGVPGDREEDILPWRDKVVMKSMVAAAGLRVPRFLSLTEALDAGPGGLPWSGETVLKPLDGAASMNVHIYPTADAALAAVREAGVPEGAEQDGFEVEEFVTGPIIHVDGMLIDGKPMVVQASRYVGTCLGYAQGTPLGSVQIELTPELSRWTLDCLAAVDITTSLFHLEGIETPDGLVFLEVGARFGGADVVDTFELATGVHLPSRYLQLVTGGVAAEELSWPEADGSRYGWFCWPSHKLGAEHCRIEGEAAFRESPLVHRWSQRSEDEPIKTVLSYADTDIPLAGVVGPGDSAELDRFLRDAFSSIRVEPVTPEKPAGAESAG
ncbi:ATP-grasp domain-containing protein [Streptomyces sp. A0958]|uniref:ATP-grasp domain-containing protein n=1 Tax=Streptomyces sp. A0958 TaxID=2563101 RepID=UPI001F0D8E89|nr:ATP-grasp domain-containing protein [Streptomyces sp. A0958]